jgi:YidC/Oxa1 family membrane protein insertase
MGATMPKSQRNMMMFLPLVFLTVVSRFPTGLTMYWVTTNLWTVGQGLITRRLMPKPGSMPARLPRSKPSPPTSGNGAVEKPAQPKPTPPQTRRVKKKKGGARR